MFFTLLTPAIGLFSFLLGAALIVIGGAYWKLILITKACHVQSFEIPMMPKRGSGERAAPERMGLNLSQLANKGAAR
jgi:hypothetical protein